MSKRSTYTQVARAESEARTRTALLDAAEERFFESDWIEASLVSIAERAGVTKQTLLRHFGSKDGLLRAAYERAFDNVKQQRLGAPQRDVSGAVRNLLDHYAELGERSLKLGSVNEQALGLDLVTRARQLHYDWVDHAFGHWIRDAAPAKREQIRAALIAICDVHTWAVLSLDLAMSRSKVQSTVELAINRILEIES